MVNLTREQGISGGFFHTKPSPTPPRDAINWPMDKSPNSEMKTAGELVIQKMSGADFAAH
jgi:hypothetical protein